MSTFERTSEGYLEHVTVPDELDAYHEARGYERVVAVGDVFLPADQAAAEAFAAAERAEVEAQVAELTGDKLAAAAKKAGVPSSLTADEKRAALVDATAPDVADLDDDPTIIKES